jgi:hypothetical protein
VAFSGLLDGSGRADAFFAPSPGLVTAPLMGHFAVGLLSAAGTSFEAATNAAQLVVR